MSELPQLDPERQKKAKEYARLRRRLFVIDLALAGGYTLVFLFSGFTTSLAAWAFQVSSNYYLALAIYFSAFALGYGVVQLPLEYYGGFILPHHYGLSTQKLSGWIKDQIKGGILGLVLGTVVIEALYLSIIIVPGWWWLVSGIFLLFFTTILATLAPIIILPLFWRLTPIPDPELVKRLENLAAKAGTKVQGIFTIDLSQRTTAANAAVLGLGRTRRIVLGDTLYKDFTPDEIETILAHELGHQVHGDVSRGILVQSILTFGGLFLAQQLLNWSAPLLSFSGPEDIAAFPLLALILGGFTVATIPLGNAYSRWREKMADEYALEITGYAEAFISAMTKLADQNLADADPEPWAELILYSHPPIKKRIALGRKYLDAESKSIGQATA
ncbi:MAG: M48 family metallopeptidase [Chloroflexi bacterium]|nr:M48 family metallopeptidase [Chloroflexota bacterium]